jgi:hypothetical protein
MVVQAIRFTAALCRCCTLSLHSWPCGGQIDQSGHVASDHACSCQLSRSTHPASPLYSAYAWQSRDSAQPCALIKSTAEPALLWLLSRSLTLARSFISVSLPSQPSQPPTQTDESGDGQVADVLDRV